MSPINILDLIQYALNTTLIVMTMMHYDWPSLETRIILCSILVFIIWGKMFEWMRMFDATSFYVKLIMVTVYDIIPFFAIFPIFLMTFGTSMYILSLNRGEEGMDDVVVGYLGNWQLDVFFNQYLLSLGDWDIGGFEGQQAILCYMFFFFATFFTQVTALNMLIAIMGDTFGKVSEG